MTIDKAIEAMALTDAESRGRDDSVYEVIGSWNQHIWSWTRNPNLAHWRGICCSIRRGGNCRRRSSIPRSPGFRRRRRKKDSASGRRRPMRDFSARVAPDSGRDMLTPAQIDRIVHDHGEQMRRFGYLPLDRGD
jgi:hypothetical protein